MRLIDANAFEDYVFDEWKQNEISNGDWIQFREWLKDQETVVEYEGDINKVIIKGEEYHKQLTTTWLGNFCPYKCEHCGFHVDSKTRYCPDCGRRANNYEV